VWQKYDLETMPRFEEKGRCFSVLAEEQSVTVEEISASADELENMAKDLQS